MDISNDTFSCEIRRGRSVDSPLLASVDVSFLTDGTDGELVLKLTETQATAISERTGYMDVKRDSGGLQLSTFLDPIPVVVQGVVTA
jgi:hypothetical protein